MNIEKVKIVVDSSADMYGLSKLPFSVAPLKIITAEKEYVDDDRLDILTMVNDLSSYSGRSSTSCPNTNDWITAFADAEYVFCVTITATLSGSYNAAVRAKEEYEALYPDRRVFVFDSLSTGPEMALIVEKIEELVLSGAEFDEVCSKTVEYSKKTGLIFVLESMKNLVNNGRVNPIVAKMAGILGIRVVGKASDKGDLETLTKSRGEAKTLDAIIEQLKKLSFTGGKIRISHCFNEKTAFALREYIKSQFSKAQVEIVKCRALCSFYAEKGGLLIGFEKE